ncbi:hypothetical protein PanWU01x14_125010 [Parasponia andersonii]|uniref:Uncharacterized protein n=1 Tax=Parasponia andersonii TaxID=3476 RepID=A0A2P5CTP6_PARAD|nr:hypothetical protein PanWU01x14_125010 [Parasponia andersonii]
MASYTQPCYSLSHDCFHNVIRISTWDAANGEWETHKFKITDDFYREEISTLEYINETLYFLFSGGTVGAFDGSNWRVVAYADQNLVSWEFFSLRISS